MGNDESTPTNAVLFETQNDSNEINQFLSHLQCSLQMAMPMQPQRSRIRINPATDSQTGESVHHEWAPTR